MTPKEARAKLRADPAYRAACDAVRRAAAIDVKERTACKRGAIPHASGAVAKFCRLIDDRPDLFDLIERADKRGLY